MWGLKRPHLSIPAFCNVMPSSPLNMYQHFWSTCCLLLRFVPWSVYFVPDYMALHTEDTDHHENLRFCIQPCIYISDYIKYSADHWKNAYVTFRFITHSADKDWCNSYEVCWVIAKLLRKLYIETECMQVVNFWLSVCGIGQEMSDVIFYSGICARTEMAFKYLSRDIILSDNCCYPLPINLRNL